MAFYIHIGCELDGNTRSNKIIDSWIHETSLWWRLEVMGIVLDI